MSEINENEQELLNTFMKKKSAGEEPPVDKNAEEMISRWDKKKQGTCPRCGNKVKYCSCPEDDYYSTVNAYRIPNTKKVEVEENYVKTFEQFVDDGSSRLDSYPKSVAQVNAFLKSKNVEEILNRGKGYFYFSKGRSYDWPSTSVYVYGINDMTFEEWYDEYKKLSNF
jgi:hypothetical protein